MCAGGVEYGWVGFGNGTYRGFGSKARADCHHAMNASIGGASDDLAKLTIELGKVKMAMAVRDPGRR